MKLEGKRYFLVYLFTKYFVSSATSLCKGKGTLQLFTRFGLRRWDLLFPFSLCPSLPFTCIEGQGKMKIHLEKVFFREIRIAWFREKFRSKVFRYVRAFAVFNFYVGLLTYFVNYFRWYSRILVHCGLEAICQHRVILFVVWLVYFSCLK